MNTKLIPMSTPVNILNSLLSYVRRCV